MGFSSYLREAAPLSAVMERYFVFGGGQKESQGIPRKSQKQIVVGLSQDVVAERRKFQNFSSAITGTWSDALAQPRIFRAMDWETSAPFSAGLTQM